MNCNPNEEWDYPCDYCGVPLDRWTAICEDCLYHYEKFGWYPKNKKRDSMDIAALDKLIKCTKKLRKR